ncbi:MAG: hypothetical protein ACI9JN_000151 [Bacteroidia bacterium]|jgi:hypothetical protein
MGMHTICLDFHTASREESFESILDKTKTGFYKLKVEEIRQHQKYNRNYDELKKTLPGFTPSGVFEKKRNTENLSGYSQIIHLDIDHIGNKMEETLRLIREIPETYAFFISPSGNGIKLFVRVESDKNRHHIIYPIVLKFYEQKLGVKIDPSCSDIARLCFFSYDPDAYLNKNSNIFKEPTINIKLIPDQLLKMVNKTQKFEVGNRNNYVFNLARICCSNGVNKTAVIEHCETTLEGLSSKEIKRTVSSAYTGKYPVKNKQSHFSDKYSLVERYLSSHYSFRYNIVNQKVETVDKQGVFITEVDDRMENNLVRELAANQINCSMDTLRTVLLSSFSIPYDPFVSYITQLPEWDGEDHIKELVDTLPLSNRSLGYKYVMKWFVAMIGSFMDPGVVNQHVLVLVGAQGIGKTTWLNRMFPIELKQYVYNGLIDPGNKDTLVYLSSCGLIIVDELETFRSKQLGQFKEVVTKPQITVRKPYGRNSEVLERRASFAASVNQVQFLTDRTGSRRFLCLDLIGSIDLKINIPIEQLWAHCFVLFQSDYRYWFNPEEIYNIDEENGKFYSVSSEEEIILKYFEPCDFGDEDYLEPASGVIQVLKGHDTLKGLELSPVHIGRALNKFGFKTKKQGGNRVYALLCRDK